MFEHQTIDAREGNVQYVKILIDIFRLDYGPVHTLVVISRCEWIQ
jgi:hypothetical protein